MKTAQKSRAVSNACLTLLSKYFGAVRPLHAHEGIIRAIFQEWYDVCAVETRWHFHTPKNVELFTNKWIALFEDEMHSAFLFSLQIIIIQLNQISCKCKQAHSLVY